MARRGLVDAIWRAWHDPRRAMADEVARGLSEPRALAQLVAACVLLFVASVPNAIREARALTVDDPVGATVTAHLFGWVAVAPLIAYGLAALVHLAARAFGARGSFLAARAALFWSALAGAPVALGVALVGVAAEVVGQGGAAWLGGLQLVALGFWTWLFAASLAEAEGFTATVRVAAMVVATFAGIGGLLALAAGGTVA